MVNLTIGGCHSYPNKTVTQGLQNTIHANFVIPHNSYFKQELPNNKNLPKATFFFNLLMHIKASILQNSIGPHRYGVIINGRG